MSKSKRQRTAEEYKALRTARGTQKDVAEKLGVSVVAISNRENGHWEITEETFMALRSLPELPASGKGK